MIADFASHGRTTARYLLLSIVVLAPFMLWMPQSNAIALLCRYAVLAAAMCVLALASRPAFVLVCVSLVPSAVLHQHLYRHWGGGQLDARIEAFFESPPGEMREYMQSHVDVLDVAIVAGAAAYLALLVYWTIGSGKPRRAVRWTAVVLVIAGMAVVGGLRFDRRLEKFPPYEVLLQAAKAKQRYSQLDSRSEFLRQHPLRRADCRLRYDRVVVVLGESATPQHMSVFGYPKPTTPFALQSGAHAFDALSPSNQTRYSLGMMLTQASPGSFDGFYRSHSLVGDLRSCGLHTVWISNQGRRGEYDSFSTSIALEADEQEFLNDWSWKSTQLDGQIVQALDARASYDRPKQATFIHLIGSHTKYRDRVPANFGSQPATDVVTQYDNTILYTDQVLSSLYGRFAGDSLLFIYVSDHGQMVSENKFGSGFLPGYQEEYRTPLLIWTSDEGAIAAIRKSIGKSRLNLESFDDVVRYLTGITPTLEVSTSATVSVLSPEFVVDYPQLDSLPED